jgi:CRP-like cAMP-binding protein
MEGLERIIGEHPFFEGLDQAYTDLIAGCGKNVRFEPGEYLFREGGPADEFYLVRHGRVALELPTPGSGAVTFQTLNPGDVVGVSWLVAPYRWSYDARAEEQVRAISLDAKCLRGKCDKDHDLGYELMTRFVPMLAQRLHATRLQVLDVYGSKA